MDHPLGLINEVEHGTLLSNTRNCHFRIRTNETNKPVPIRVGITWSLDHVTLLRLIGWRHRPVSPTVWRNTKLKQHSSHFADLGAWNPKDELLFCLKTYIFTQWQIIETSALSCSFSWKRTLGGRGGLGSNCKKNQSFGTHCKEESSESKGKAKVIIFSQQWLSSLPLDWQLTKGKYRLFRKNSV